MIDEFSTSLMNEFDYLMEGRNADNIIKQFFDDSTIHIPKTHWDYTSRRILIMEMLHGIKVTKTGQLNEDGYNLSLIIERIAHSLLTQVLDHGLFHGDPYQGYIFIMPGNVVSYLVFALLDRVNNQMKHHFSSLMIAVEKNSTEK